jgi:hypothetical protein
MQEKKGDLNDQFTQPNQCIAPKEEIIQNYWSRKEHDKL